MVDISFESMLDEINDARSRDTRAPVAIRLGQQQRNVVEKYVKDLAGTRDIGPLTQFAGLEIRDSRSADKCELVWPGDQEPPAEPVQSGPEAAPADGEPNA
jgi:hypothetical protein